MNRRHFLGIAPLLLAGAAVARPAESTSVGSLPAVFMTVIAPPALFVAGREAISSAGVSSLVPENTTIRLRSWWDGRLDPSCSEMIRFTDDADYVDRIANIITIETSGSLNATSPVHAIPKRRHRRRPLTRAGLEYPERSVWREMSAILAETEAPATIVRVPAYWDEQFWHQVARAPAADSDGNRVLDAVERLGHDVRYLCSQEERHLSHISALALLRTASAPRRPTELDGVCFLYRLHCITDHRGLRTRIMVDNR